MEESSAGDGENAATDLIPQMRPAVDERGMGGLVVLNVSCVPVDERQFRKNVVDAGEEATSSERKFNVPAVWKSNGQLSVMSWKRMLLNVRVIEGCERMNMPDAEVAERDLTCFRAELPFDV